MIASALRPRCVIRRWRFQLRSRIVVVHLEVPGVALTASGLTRSLKRRIVLVERGGLL